MADVPVVDCYAAKQQHKHDSRDGYEGVGLDALHLHAPCLSFHMIAIRIRSQGSR
jgi:hypothetical protein